MSIHFHKDITNNFRIKSQNSENSFDFAIIIWNTKIWQLSFADIGIFIADTTALIT